MVPRKRFQTLDFRMGGNYNIRPSIRMSWLTLAVSALSLSSTLLSQHGTMVVGAATSALRSDVRRGNNNNNNNNNRQLHAKLMEMAIPKSEYDALQGSSSSFILDEADHRQLNQDKNDNNNNKNGDDYFLAEDYMYSLSGYSLKYATCQPLQQFSDSAAKAGEYSPMITDDVVVLRLCPTKTCSSYFQYGCHYNFAEYVIGLKDFIRIMLRYTTDRREKMCNYCVQCGYGDNNGGRFLNEDQGGNNNNQDKGENNNGENKQNNNNNQDQKNENNNNNEKNENNNNNQKNENNNNDKNENKDKEEDNQEGKNNENEQDNEEDNNEEDVDSESESSSSSSSSGSYVYDPCDDKDTYCYNYDKDCGGANDDKYIDYLDYMDYLDCVKVDDKNNNRYYVRPRCDATQGTIKMAVYRDPYCSMYAGNDVSIKSIGLGFRDGIFEDFYDGRCISCSDTTNPPDFGADEYLCNRMHHDSAKCTSNLAYQVFDDHVDDETECSFIESVRFGTYDSSGQFATDSMSKVKQTVTKGQLIALAVSVAICVAMAIYACYLHHAMTNLLIYSLSHSHLLPPSRHRSRQNRGRTRNRDYDEDDWDHSAAKIPPIS